RQSFGTGDLTVGVLQCDVAAGGQLVRAPVVGDLVGQQDFPVEPDLDIAARDDEVAPAILHQLVHGDLELAALSRGRDMNGEHDKEAERRAAVERGGRHLQSRVPACEDIARAVERHCEETLTCSPHRLQGHATAAPPRDRCFNSRRAMGLGNPYWNLRGPSLGAVRLWESSGSIYRFEVERRATYASRKSSVASNRFRLSGGRSGDVLGATNQANA